jgi:hypothetical protein
LVVGFRSGGAEIGIEENVGRHLTENEAVFDKSYPL